MCFQQIAPNFNLNRLFNKVFDISIELRQAKNVVEKSVQYYVETQQSYRIALLALQFPGKMEILSFPMGERHDST